MNSDAPSTRAEKPIAPPPVLYIGAMLVSLVLDKVLPVLPAWDRTLLTTAIGIALIILNFGIFAAAVTKFKQAKTHLPHWKPTTTLVTTGIFAYSRNPIYVAITLLYLGLAFLLASTWMFLLLLPLLITMHYGVVKCEEAYLREKFGDAYADYCAKVRRWV